MESHSYSRWLMFYRFYRGGQSSWVICVIAGGKGTIEVGCQSGGGRVQRMRNTLVCMRRLAHAHLKAVWHPHPLTFSVSCLQSKHTHPRLTNKTTLGRALKKAHMHKFVPMMHFTRQHCFCTLAPVYPSPTLHTFLLRLF